MIASHSALGVPKAGISPEGKWLLKDESSDRLDILNFAQKSNA